MEREDETLAQVLKSLREIKTWPSVRRPREFPIDCSFLCSPNPNCCRYFIGTESTFSFRIQEEREILGFPEETTFNVFCPNEEVSCKGSTRWTIRYWAAALRSAAAVVRFWDVDAWRTSLPCCCWKQFAPDEWWPTFFLLDWCSMFHVRSVYGLCVFREVFEPTRPHLPNLPNFWNAFPDILSWRTGFTFYKSLEIARAWRSDILWWLYWWSLVQHFFFIFPHYWTVPMKDQCLHFC